MSRMLEAYLICHVLIFVSAALAGRLGGRPHSRLRVARLLFMSCVLAPVAMSFFQPASQILIHGTSLPEPGVALEALETVSNPPAAAAMFAAATTVYPYLSEPWLWGLIGIACLWHLGRLLRDLMRIRRVIARSVALRAFGRVRLWVSEDCSVPFSIRSLRRAHIIVPVSLLSRPGAIRIAVAHESEHHRQGDCLFAYLVEFLRGVFYLNPGMHHWCRLLGDLQEYSCDEALIGRRRYSPHAYGRCLLEVAHAASPSSVPPRRELAAASLGVGMAHGATSSPSFLRGRIMKLSTYQSVAPRSIGLGILAITMAIGTPTGSAFALRGTLTGDAESHLDTSHLDPHVQAIADKAIRSTLLRNHATSAAVVVADPATGRILAFAEAHAAPKGAPAPESWATRHFFPGSTVKPFVVAAALDAGITTENRVYHNHAPYMVGGVRFSNNGNAPEKATTKEMLVNSFNVSAIKIAQDLGAKRLHAAFDRFGLAGPDGSAAPLALARATLGEGYPVSLGAMVRAYAALANNGKMPGGEGSPATTPASAARLRGMLVESVRHGTGQRAAVVSAAVAGKTGTIGADRGAPDAPNLAMFAGFAPADAPRIVAFALVEAPHAYGGKAAAPAFQEIARKAIPLLKGRG